MEYHRKSCFAKRFLCIFLSFLRWQVNNKLNKRKKGIKEEELKLKSIHSNWSRMESAYACLCCKGIWKSKLSFQTYLVDSSLHASSEDFRTTLKACLFSMQLKFMASAKKPSADSCSSRDRIIQNSSSD